VYRAARPPPSRDAEAGARAARAVGADGRGHARLSREFAQLGTRANVTRHSVPFVRARLLKAHVYARAHADRRRLRSADGCCRDCMRREVRAAVMLACLTGSTVMNVQDPFFRM
jgi:hypothetical protein